MNTQEHIQKKPLATMPAPRLHNGFETRGFTMQTKPNKASHEQPRNLQTQLSRAARFGHNLSQMPVHTSAPPMAALQTKAPATGQVNEPVQRQDEKEKEEELGQMKAAQTAQPSIQRQPIQEAKSPGSSSSMPKAVRAKMENSFGTSFSDVSIHTESAQAKGIGALAYTQGNHVHFAPGQYNPHSLSGQALLGHELTHVVQQRAGRVPMPHQSKGSPINADRSLEKEADDMGALAARGERVQVPGATGGMVESSASPVQNSTEPVQCFLPLLGGLLGGLGGGGGGGMLMQMLPMIMQMMGGGGG